MISTGWSWYVFALAGLNVFGLAWLLWWTATRRPGDPAPEDTSHYWDGDITEYNKPMPRWWINGFYLSMVFAIGYVGWYGGLGGFEGIGNWSSQAEHAADKTEWDARLAETFRPYDGKPIDQLAADATATGLGRSIFANTCATCHGSSAQGAPGYPNLTDDIWHWGGEPDQILATVMHGRQAAMPALGAVVGGEAGITELAVYVQSLSGQRVDPRLAANGKTRFQGICVACHGVEGTGNIAMGAPDLTDGYWLYGGDYDSIRTAIRDGRNGSMPAHAGLLGETRARLVAAYVYSLSQRSALAKEGAVPVDTASVEGAAEPAAVRSSP